MDQNLYTVVRSAKRNRVAKQASVFKNMVDTCLHAYRYKKNDKGVPVQSVIHNLSQYEQYFPNEAGGKCSLRVCLMYLYDFVCECVIGPHAGAKLYYEPPTTHTRLKDEAGLPLRQMAEKTPELGRNMLVR